MDTVLLFLLGWLALYSVLAGAWLWCNRPRSVSQPISLPGEVADAQFMTKGYVFASNGKRTVVITHGTPDGTLPYLTSDLLVKADGIVCCHPALVKATHPCLADRVIGDWDGETRVRFQRTSGRIDWWAA